MKRFAQFVCVLMAAVLLFTTPAFAAESRASNFFMMTSTYLDQTTGANFEVWFDVTAVGVMGELGVKTIKVQRSLDKSDWETVKTYSKSDYSQMVDFNTGAHADCVTYSGSYGYYYRAYVTFYAKNSTGSGTYSCYTASLDLT